MLKPDDATVRIAMNDLTQCKLAIPFEFHKRPSVEWHRGFDCCVQAINPRNRTDRTHAGVQNFQICVYAGVTVRCCAGGIEEGHLGRHCRHLINIISII
jgi:hypothetical protein